MVKDNLEDGMNNNEVKTFINWGSENEKILKGWADRAQCFSIMHDRAYKRYYGLNAWFSIPVIIITTITGTGNFAQSSIHDSWKNKFIICIGTANLISAIIVSIAQFLRVAQESEAHLRSHIDWDKFSRKVRIELSKIREERLDCNTFISTCQQEYDKLIAGSPNIPTDIGNWFKKFISKDGKLDRPCGCQLCIYHCFCFPFGVECCDSPFYCCECFNKKQLTDNNLDIEIPEIVDGVKTIRINSSDEINEYDIYNPGV